MPSTTARRLANLVFGGSCYLCRGAVRNLGEGSDEGLLCAPCSAELPLLDAARCPRCADASPGGLQCGQCLARAPSYDATLAALAYRFPADVLVQALKYRGELALAPLFARLLCALPLARERPDVLLPVPLSATRLRQRGYNQAMEIARPLGRTLGLRIAPRLCERTRDTPAQTDLPLAERSRNVRGAFRCAERLDGAAVAVLDDVMTTGATLDEIAATLKRAGAARVVNWVVARTPPPATP